MPFFIPIDTCSICSASTFCSCFENKFCYIFVRWTLNAAIGKVFDNISTILTNRSKVEYIATRIECQYQIELLNENGRRLMNSTHHGLSGLRKFLQESDNTVSRV